MGKQKLINIIQKVLNTDCDLGFLSQLQEKDIETLVACIRDRVENNR